MIIIYFFIGILVLIAASYLVYQYKNKGFMEQKGKKVDPKKDQPI